MTVAVIVALAAIALLLAMLAIVSWRRLRVERARADQTETELDAVKAQLVDRDAALTEVQTRAADAEQDRAQAVERQHEAAIATIAAAEKERGEIDERSATIEAERDDLASERDRLATDYDDLGEEVVVLRERLLGLESRADRFRDEHRPGIEAEALWQLELSRAARTWRHSVAVAPDQPSPFTDAVDPLQVAVEVEVAALREEVGAAMELTWDVTVIDPARRLVVLRLTQELLSVASREQQAVRLHGYDGADGAVHLHLTVPDDHAPMEPIGLDGVEHLVTVDSADGILVIVR